MVRFVFRLVMPEETTTVTDDVNASMSTVIDMTLTSVSHASVTLTTVSHALPVTLTYVTLTTMSQALPVTLTLALPVTLTDVTLTTMSQALPVVNRSHVWTADVIQRVATLVPLMAATLLGNAVTMVVLSCSRYRSVNSRINIFIVNLAAGDLAVCCFTMSTEVGFVIIIITMTLSSRLIQATRPIDTRVSPVAVDAVAANVVSYVCIRD